MKTEILKITDKKTISRAVDVLAKGGIIIYPTETVYGVGADATNDKAVKKVITVKKRSASKHIIIAVSDLKMAKNYAIITKKAEILTKTFMPGPLTIVVEAKTKLKDVKRQAARRRIRFRIPDNKFVLSVIRKFGKPITTTSANISGGENIYKIKDIIKTFDGKVDMIIDGGNIPKRKPSTVFDTIKMKVVREGPVSEKQIIATLKAYS